ncbi:hypothetical protein EON64_06435 [archaeon]|nr:MAG: hypothetical protein EON64_06435 [archaeon]
MRLPFAHLAYLINMPNVSLGGLATFNMQHGFVEAIIRGFRSSFMTDETYHHLTQCETLEVIAAYNTM